MSIRDYFEFSQTLRPLPAVFRNLVFVADKLKNLIRNSGRKIPALTVLLHIFLGFSAENENEDVPIQEYFVFSHALHLLSAVFLNSFSLRKNIVKISNSKRTIPTLTREGWQLSATKMNFEKPPAVGGSRG